MSPPPRRPKGTQDLLKPRRDTRPEISAGGVLLHGPECRGDSRRDRAYVEIMAAGKI